ncbi:Oxysterol-binding protein-domain-containing protein [Chaetomium sp. MPI-SDFR-AT-0129]|nr:Oxysterol-binding protein-domain-containing protein [Chaetomium sp. MPI-SDFR-AT-0129]
MSTHEDTAPSASGSGTGLGTTASAPTAPAHEPSIHPAQPPSVKGHSSKLSVSGSAIGRTISNSPSVAGGRSPYLSDKGTSLESSVRKFRIVDALRNGDTAFISKAIRESAENAPRMSTSSFTTFSGPLDDTTILHLAIQCAEQPVVEYVLSDGAGSLDINARDREGNTPLHVAAIQGRAQIVKLLLENKEINDAIANHHGRLPIDLARNPEIFQQLQLSRSLFAENKVRQVQDLILHGELKVLEQVLEESRFKTVLDINSPEFASEPTTVEAGGTLLHEAARRKNSRLIQVLLLHGADPFRRDRKGKLPQDVTKDEITRAMLKKSPAAVAAQRGIQEKAVLGSTTQGAATATPGDPLAGREAREMKGYLKKWTNYRKGYQLRWFVLEDGVLSYYKHQDDAGSACRGAINMRIAKLHMSADEKTKFEIHGKSSVKYTLKANHEVEAKRWFWALNNSIQWTKDQAKEEERQKARNAELLKQAKAEHTHLGDSPSENASVAEQSRSSIQLTRMHSSARASSKSGFPTIGSNEGDDFVDAATEADNKTDQNGGTVADEGDEDEDYDEHSSGQDAPPANKDAFNITAQSAKLQLESMAHVTAALLLESSKNPAATLTDPKTSQALSTYDAAIRSLTGLIGDLLRISKDRDAYWQYRLDRESEMRRMWEESMAQVAKEQEALEARVGEAESKRRITKRILKEVVEGGMLEGGQIPLSSSQAAEAAIQDEAQVQTPPEAVGAKSPTLNVSRRQTVMTQIADISDSESDGEEFFDAVDAGEVEVSQLPPSELTASQEEQQLVISDAYDISSSFKGYENGIRTRLKMDADDRPKISLWGILKSMVGKDMTKMTLPVSFNEPTSLLYRCGEDMEYADLLDLAADRTDSVERLLYVGAFAASEYASTIGRVAKPFNPLLGETFEYVRPDKNYRFFIEQVSHHPPIGAAWAESPKWTYYGESAVKSKFYGRSFDINPLGTWFLKLRPAHGGKEDFYTWKKVTSSVVGIITGNPVVDNYGPMEIKNWTTGEVCYIEFKPRGWTASSAYVITGKVVDANGRVRFSLGGRWNSKLYARYTPGFEATIDDAAAAKADTSGPPQADAITDPNKAFLIWQANPRPQGIPFNLTPFVLTFNHIDDQLRPWIAPTDSRLRPDQRAMEEGEYDFAATEKNRLEEGQRARRRVREAKGEEFIPAWFTKAKCEVTGESYWKFNGGYWEKREKAGPGAEGAKVWEGLEKIF